MYHTDPRALADGASELVLTLAEAVRPAREWWISEWAEGRLQIPGETGTARPGPLSWEGYEYLREPLDTLSPQHPSRRTALLGGAQTGKTQIGVVATLFYAAEVPRPWLVGLPSIDEVAKYNREKWQPIVDATAELRRKIRPVTSRDEQGSTNTYKRFAGGRGGFVNSGSAKGLQMVSAALIVLEETPNWELDVGGRGDPVKQLRARQIAWELAGAKELHNSTPGIKGSCPITRDFDAGDQRRLYHPCPHCGDYLRLDYKQLQGLVDVRGATPDPHFVCPSCFGRIEHRHKPALVRAGVWIPTFVTEREDNPAPAWHFPAAELAAWRGRDVEGRQPSYHLWQIVSPSVDWAYIAEQHRDAQLGDQAAKTVFSQQILGEAVEVVVTGVQVDALLAVRERSLARDQVPEGAYLLTGSVDLNGSFASWGVWAWGPSFESWLVATGEIEGSPDSPELWAELAQLIGRTWPHAEGGRLPVSAWGVDSGYGTANVYAFASRYSHVKALDGRDGWGLSPLRRGPKGECRGPDGLMARAQIWQVGTWDLKRALFEGLGCAVDKAGAGVPGKIHLPGWVDKAWLEELTAETLIQKQDARTGIVSEERWKRIRRRNEALDLWVYCAALAKARGCGVPGAEPDWVELRNRLHAQADLEGLWDRPTAPVAPEPAETQAVAARTESLAERYARLNGGSQ